MSRFPFSLFFFMFLQTFSLTLAFTPLQSLHGNNTHVLQDVLKEISVRQKWNLDKLRISKLGVKKVRVGTGQSYEFRIRFGKSYIVLKFPFEVTAWRNFSKAGVDLEDAVTEASSFSVLDSFKLEGPFELRVASDSDDRLSLSLPLNTSHTHLERIIVGEGISVEITRGREVSAFYKLHLGFPLNGKGGYWPFWHSLCESSLPIRISGSASVVAYRAQNPDDRLKTTFLSEATVELLSDKCYRSHTYKRVRPIDSLSSKIARLEKILRGFLGDRIHELGGFLNAKLKASTILRFQLELEKNIEGNGTLAEWRTRPTTERVWFDVLARVEAEKLKPLKVKKVVPFAAVDSVTWSNLMSNISFTKFPSILGPQEALTLDVKW